MTERIDTHPKFNIGDRVVCIEQFCFANVGETGTIVRYVGYDEDAKKRHFDNGYYVNWDRNVGGWGNSLYDIQDGHGERIFESYLEPLYKDKNGGIMENKFKVGDRVKLKGYSSGMHEYCLGVIKEIVECENKAYVDFDKYCYGTGSRELCVPNGYGKYVYLEDLELSEEPLNTFRPEPKPCISEEEFDNIKVGQYVRLGWLQYCSIANKYMEMFSNRVCKVSSIDLSGKVLSLEEDAHEYRFPRDVIVEVMDEIKEEDKIRGLVGGEYDIDLTSKYAMAYIPETLALCANNSQKFTDIIKNNYVIVNMDTYRVENNKNPHIKDALDEAHILNWRIDNFLDCVLYKYISRKYFSRYINYKINFSNGTFERFLGEDEAECPKCHEIIKKTEIFGKYCINCLKDMEFVHRFGYHDYCGGYPTPKGVDTSKNLVFGCEIERDYLSRNNSSDFDQNLDDAMTEIIKIFHEKELEEGNLKRSEVFMSDGSLHYNGLEWITFPHTFTWYVNNKDKFQKAIDIIKDYGFKDTSNAGNHIHMNRDFFGENDEFCAAKIAILFNTYWEEFVAIAGRDIRKCNYTTKPTQTKNDSVFNVVKKTIDGRREHGVAVNLQHNSTIEIRLWSAIDSADELIFFLDNMQALARYVKKIGLEKVQKANFTDFMKYYKLKSSLETAKKRLSARHITTYTETIKKMIEKVGK